MIDGQQHGAAHQTGLVAAREEFGVDAQGEQPVRGAITPGGGVRGLPLRAKSLPTLDLSVKRRAAEARG